MQISRQRKGLGHKIRAGLRNPGRIIQFVQRQVRHKSSSRANRDSGYLAFYRQVMKHDVHHRGPARAVGSETEEHWDAIGKLQFMYLVQHGLKPSDHFLDLGCGNLRAWRIVDYLQTGHFTGLDISPEVLISAHRTISRKSIQDKVPYLFLVFDMSFDFLPDNRFDVIHAHSVFTHCPAQVIEECLGNIGRIMTPNAFFDFTFFSTDGRAYNVLNEDFFYRPSDIRKLGESNGFTVTFLDDWEYDQPKARLRKQERMHQ